MGLINTDDYIVCECCGQLRKVFKPAKNTNYCQICYKKTLEEYCFYDYKNENVKKRLKNPNALKVLELLIKKGKDVDYITEKVGLNRQYVLSIISRYTKKVNVDGEERPF